MEATSWGQLSGSTRSALQWAGAIARYREEEVGRDPSSSEGDVFDLLIGMLLAHPANAEAKVFLDHFRIPVGEVMPKGFPRPSPDALERHLKAVPGDASPSLSGDVEEILREGLSIGLRTGNPQVAELRAFFVPMLEGSNEFAKAAMQALSARGQDLSLVSQATREFIEKPETPPESDEKAKTPERPSGYAEFLKGRIPYDARPIDLPNYKADHGRSSLADDLVGIQAEVDAFAYLIASRGLTPPLAIGLFGDWGSGKSFFMESVRKRISALTRDPAVQDSPQFEVPFWKKTIQIEFNAWHYVEGELWASLVNHIFNGLRMEDEEPSLVQKRRNHWLRRLDSTRIQLARLEKKRGVAERKLSQKQQVATTLSIERDAKIAKLEQLRAKRTQEVVLSSTVKKAQDVLDSFLRSTDAPTGAEVLRGIEETRDALYRGRTVLWSLGKENLKSLWPWLAWLVVGVPALVWVLAQLNAPDIASAFTGLSAAGAAVLGVMRKVTNAIGERVEELNELQGLVNAEIDEARGSIDAEVVAAEKEVDKVDRQLKSLASQRKALTAQLDRLQHELERTTPAHVLVDFVTDRVGSEDYRKHLGIPALVQRDFRQLASLVREQNEDSLDPNKSQAIDRDVGFNRIILYIDDLDRCPEDRVTEVLQAVHLLLAFDLFVVVVAVDSRWLSHALTKKFDALKAKTGNNKGATPDDYLEKIFQIPFWVKPLGTSARKDIVHGLLEGHVRTPEGTVTAETDAQRPSMGDPQRDVLRGLDPANAPPNLEAAALALSRAELEFLDSLAPLLGTTPRSVKRFVNLYQLIRIIFRLDPDGGAPDRPAEHELLAFVLATGEGLPGLGPAILEAACAAETTRRFEDLLKLTSITAQKEEKARLDEWMSGREEWRQIPAPRLREAFRRVERFLFRVGDATGAA